MENSERKFKPGNGKIYPVVGATNSNAPQYRGQFKAFDGQLYGASVWLNGEPTDEDFTIRFSVEPYDPDKYKSRQPEQEATGSQPASLKEAFAEALAADKAQQEEAPLQSTMAEVAAKLPDRVQPDDDVPF